MMLGIPIVAILLPLCWFLLVFVLFRRRIDLGADGMEQYLRAR